MKFLILFALTFFLLNFAEANVSKKALIYNGPGACPVCPGAVGSVLQKMGFLIEYVKPGQLTKLKFSEAVLYVQPGGTDRPNDILEALKPGEKLNLKNFVRGGGRYLGICSGGYLAGDYVVDDKKAKAFGLIPITVDEESEDASPKLETIIWNNSVQQVYFQDAPSFNIKSVPSAVIWATYRDSGHGAALIYDFGKGRVGVVGPHLEADETWFAGDNLTFPGLKTKLLIDFINALLN